MAFLKAEEKQVLLDRYGDLEWCEDVTQLQCARCHRLAIRHYVSNCLHIFCVNCKTTCSDGEQWKCSQCQEHVTKLDDQDFDLEIKIHQLRIFCPNKKFGCKYEDQLRKMPEHVKVCENTEEAAQPLDCNETHITETVVVQVSKINLAINEMQVGICQVKNSIREQLEQLESKMDKRIDELKSDLQVQADRITSMHKQMKKMNKVVGKLQIECKENTQDLLSFKEQINERTLHIETSFQEKMEKTSQAIICMETQMASMTTEIETFNAKVISLTESQLELRMDLVKKQQEIQIQLERDRQEFREQCETARKEHQEILARECDRQAQVQPPPTVPCAPPPPMMRHCRPMGHHNRRGHCR